MLTYEPMEFLAREWIKAFKKAPSVTSIITVVAVCLIGVISFFLDQADRNRRETARLQNADYQTQRNQLSQTETNLRQLLDFINMQKIKIREAEDAIMVLKKEQESLRPIVQSDKAVVEALFRAQEDRARASLWRERWIGFGFGILASLLASFIWFAIRFWISGGGQEP